MADARGPERGAAAGARVGRAAHPREPLGSAWQLVERRVVLACVGGAAPFDVLPYVRATGITSNADPKASRL